MKKYLSLVMAVAVMASLAGCSDNTNVSEHETDTGSSASTTEKPYIGADIVGDGSSTSRSEMDEGEYTLAADTKGDPGFFGGLFDGIGAADEAEGDFEYFADSAVAAESLTGGAGADCCVPPVVIDPYYEPIPPQAGLLTGGEWNDNDHWYDWVSLYQSHEDWNYYREMWRIEFDHRISVKVTTDDGAPVEGAAVLTDDFAAVTDNEGMAYLFYDDEDVPEKVTVTYKDIEKQLDGINGDTELECTLGDLTLSDEKYLDLMLMVDTTGSMSDELMYLQTELRDVVERVADENANLPIRVSVNFYRDIGDEYIVREFPFTKDLNNAVDTIMAQNAMGGGDFPEAVHTAMTSAIKNHEWDDSAVKLMFLVLDAPPHEDAQIIDEVNGLTELAAENGIRIIPVASSGIDKSTEYLLRTMAFTTGGTYTFLTDDSGIGGSHIEPTIGDYQVEKLNDMMVRIINGYLA